MQYTDEIEIEGKRKLHLLLILKKRQNTLLILFDFSSFLLVKEYDIIYKKYDIIYKEYDMI